MTPNAAQSGIPVEIRVLGSLSVLRNGLDVTLPQSKKTRALLAYLAVNRKSHRRERLCEMFWDVPDDPRGALRWSLSKLRSITGDALEATREIVALAPGATGTDYDTVRQASTTDLAALDADALEATVRSFRGPFLEDLSLPRCPEFEAWRVSIANETELLELRMRRALIDRLRDEPARALIHVHALLSKNPDDASLAEEAERLAQHSRKQALAGSPSPEPAAPAPMTRQSAPVQDVRYCRTKDGVQIAYSSIGEGPPLVKTANWMSHIEFDRDSPIWRHWIDGLSEQNRLIRYDERGNGLSDWDVDDVSFEAMVADLESVVDTMGLERFALLGVSQGCAVSVAYAVRHPERVSRMILYGGYVRGWRARGEPNEVAQREAMTTLIRQGWGRNNPAFRQMFTSLFVPGATPEQMDWFNELQRRSVSAENAARLHHVFGDIDVVDLLAKVTTPTMVLHTRDDAVVPFAAGRAFATGIPGARFVVLESKNHILLEGEPAFEKFVDEVRRFLADT